MPTSSLQNLVKKLQKDFSAYQFVAGDIFKWSFARQEITYAPNSTANAAACLLHEVAHAELRHQMYQTDIELIRMEVAAWEYAKSRLGPPYHIFISDDYANEALEEYRMWLYKRSLCPACQQTGLQTSQTTFICINCVTSWKANDARQCGVRRDML